MRLKHSASAELRRVFHLDGTGQSRTSPVPYGRTEEYEHLMRGAGLKLRGSFGIADDERPRAEIFIASPRTTVRAGLKQRARRGRRRQVTASFPLTTAEGESSPHASMMPLPRPTQLGVLDYRLLSRVAYPLLGKKAVVR